MLARPEPGTREHMLLWLASQPKDKIYPWADPRRCACGTYARETMGKSNLWWVEQAKRGGPFAELNNLASKHLTYGALWQHAREYWSK